MGIGCFLFSLQMLMLYVRVYVCTCVSVYFCSKFIHIAFWEVSGIIITYICPKKQWCMFPRVMLPLAFKKCFPIFPKWHNADRYKESWNCSVYLIQHWIGKFKIFVQREDRRHCLRECSYCVGMPHTLPELYASITRTSLPVDDKQFPISSNMALPI